MPSQGQPPSCAHGLCLSSELDTHVLIDTNTDRVIARKWGRPAGHTAVWSNESRATGPLAPLADGWNTPKLQS